MLRHVIDKSLGLLVVSAAGPVDIAHLRALRERLKDDPDYDNRMPVLLDLSGASALEFTATDLRHLAASVMMHPAARQAIVVGSDLGFGLARMFETFSAVGQHSDNVRAFRDVAEARSWVLSAPDRG